MSVTTIAGADTDNRAGDGFRYFLCESRRDLLQDNGETAGFVQEFGVVEQFGSLCLFFGAQAVAAELIDALRRQTEVSHDGHAGLDHVADSRQDLFAALEFDGIATGFLEDLDGIAHGFLFAHLITAKRHVANDERVLLRADNSFGEEDHLIHGDGQRVLVAANDVAGAVAH